MIAYSDEMQTSDILVNIRQTDKHPYGTFSRKPWVSQNQKG